MISQKCDSSPSRQQLIDAATIWRGLRKVRTTYHAAQRMMKGLHNVGMVAASGLLRSRSPSALVLLPLKAAMIRNYASSGRRTTTQLSEHTSTSSVSAATTSTSAVNHDDSSVSATIPPTTLLVASQQDAASCAIVSALLGRGGWSETSPGAEPNKSGRNGQAWNHERSPTSLWSIEGRLLDLDDADRRWTKPAVDQLQPQAQRERPADVVFLSKHVAKSGVPALCVHPIGLPDPSSSDAAGGRPGRCPPPSPRLAACLRELRQATRQAELDETFDTTLEVTHHGPWLETPAMFVEIGSSEEHWGRADAAEVWADVLTRLLGLDGSPAIEDSWASLSPSLRAESTAYVGLGGGHYAPRHGDVAKRSGRYIGHMLASYALDFREEGRWREAVKEAVQSTRAAFPGAGGGVAGGVAALIDKKAFRSADRTALLEFLGELGVEHRFNGPDC